VNSSFEKKRTIRKEKKEKREERRATTREDE
jgi:hypothetical protein